MSKFLSLGYAVLSFALVFVAERLGDVLQAALSIFGMVGGPLLGIFTLGMFFPWANAKGAVSGAVAGLAITFWIGFGAQVAKAKGFLKLAKMPTSVEGCLVATNETTTPSSLIFTTLATSTPPMPSPEPAVDT
jgi:sodium-coupled monocarboxylate transporter 8/12